jgi:hypothetical protein
VVLDKADDDSEPGERAPLDASLELSEAQASAGQLVGGDAVVQKLLSRG